MELYSGSPRLQMKPACMCSQSLPKTHRDFTEVPEIWKKPDSLLYKERGTLTPSFSQTVVRKLPLLVRGRILESFYKM